MEVMRSRHGKTVIVIGGNHIIKFLMVKGNGPEFGSMGFKDFYGEFNLKLSMSVEAAALSFLGVAKRALKHNHEVVAFLLGEILMKNLAEMSLEELVSRYNSLCVAAGKKPRKSFDSKKAALEAIERLDGEITPPTPAQVKAAETSTQRRSITMTEENKEVKPRGKGIGARAMELLIEGKSTQEVIDIVKAEIDGANPTPATIAWYKNKLRQEGKLAKAERKPKAEKKSKKADAEVAPADEAEDAEDAEDAAE